MISIELEKHFQSETTESDIENFTLGLSNACNGMQWGWGSRKYMLLLIMILKGREDADEASVALQCMGKEEE